MLINKKKLLLFCAILFTLAVGFLGFWQFTENLQSETQINNLWNHNALSRFILIYLMVFVAILALRYLVLLLFSLPEHIRYIHLPAKITEAEEDLPFISVIVPAYNESIVIHRTIDSLLNIDYPNYEILVIDDGSLDDTPLQALAYNYHTKRVDLKVIRTVNKGKAEALNTGIAYSQGEFILNVDADSVLSKNVLRTCIRHFRDPKVGAVAGNIKIVNDNHFLTKLQAIEYITTIAMVRRSQSYFGVINIIPGPLGMFRRQALHDLGGYTSDTYAEDCDVTLQLLIQGWHVKYESMAQSMTEAPSQIIPLIRQRYRWTRGILQAIRKHLWVILHPIRAGKHSLILGFMLFEGILWPVTNVLAHLFFFIASIQYGVPELAFYWWLQLVFLDVAAAIYSIILEHEDLNYLFMVVFMRFYALIIDIAKIFASLEEMLHAPMSWNKLQREGKML